MHYTHKCYFFLKGMDQMSIKDETFHQFAVAGHDATCTMSKKISYMSIQALHFVAVAFRFASSVAPSLSAACASFSIPSPESATD